MKILHVLNRGVDKRDIFLDAVDYNRFVYGLFIFNNQDAVDMAALRAKGLTMSFSEERCPIVHIHGWCLMNNHFHLLISELVENGTTLFLRKLNIGYAKYFNERHDRSGTLFQGRTKKVPISTDAQFNYILHYIHLNPLDYLQGAEGWRIRSKSGIRNADAALKHLGAYPWSSYLDYAGRNNFPQIITKDLFETSPGEYQASLEVFLREAEIEAEGFAGLHLE